VIIFASFKFEAAHQLPFLPADHQCGRLHGHTYRVDLELSASVADVLKSPQGWIMDFDEVARVWQATIFAKLDHRFLNDIPGMENPTSEHLACWIFSELRFALPLLSAVAVYETTETCARVTRADMIGAP
jgi:6-pyruvoyltetrahydropterin/6-carboxytetrahydropterin synthase